MNKKYFFSLVLIPTLVLILGFNKAVPNKNLIVHEWGIFTSLHSSTGERLSGLHLDEGEGKFPTHTLPPLQKAPQNALSKIESGLYLYSTTVPKVSIDIGFPNGIMHQWYPQRNGGESWSSSQEINFSKEYNGLISWDNILLLPADNSEAFSKELGTWQAFRNTKSNKLKAKDEVEKFLFYNAVGKLDVLLSFQFKSDKELLIENKSDKNIPYLFVYEKNDDGGNVWWTGSLDKKGSKTCTTTISSISYVNAKAEEFGKALIKEGLYSEEAEAILKSFEHNWLKKNGFRVFYIFPKEDMDDILPTNISPRATDYQRVFIGKCEILMPGFEQQIVKAHQDNYFEEEYQNDAYFAGMLERIQQLKK